LDDPVGRQPAESSPRPGSFRHGRQMRGGRASRSARARHVPAAPASPVASRGTAKRQLKRHTNRARRSFAAPRWAAPARRRSTTRRSLERPWQVGEMAVVRPVVHGRGELQDPRLGRVRESARRDSRRVCRRESRRRRAGGSAAGGARSIARSDRAAQRQLPPSVASQQPRRRTRPAPVVARHRDRLPHPLQSEKFTEQVGLAV
jgi:hypothetical protein